MQNITNTREHLERVKSKEYVMTIIALNVLLQNKMPYHKSLIDMKL